MKLLNFPISAFFQQTWKFSSAIGILLTAAALVRLKAYAEAAKVLNAEQKSVGVNGTGNFGLIEPGRSAHVQVLSIGTRSGVANSHAIEIENRRLQCNKLCRKSYRWLEGCADSGAIAFLGDQMQGHEDKGRSISRSSRIRNSLSREAA